MRLLLDSHVALWWLAGDSNVGPETAAMIHAADTVYFSPVTPWELGIKRSLGKIDFPDGLVLELVAAGLEEQPITSAHAETAAALHPHHRDPFDRMLIAQATIESLSLITADTMLDAYDIPIINARS